MRTISGGDNTNIYDKEDTETQTGSGAGLAPVQYNLMTNIVT